MIMQELQSGLKTLTYIIKSFKYVLLEPLAYSSSKVRARTNVGIVMWPKHWCAQSMKV